MSKRSVRRGCAWILVAGLGGMTMPAVGAETDANGQRTRGPAPSKPAQRQLDRYQVAAGTALLLKLSTPLNSSTVAVDDQVEAVLWSPIVQDGVELVPVDSVVFGKVTEFVRASDRTPTGSITFVFKIIEHGGTGSRETLSTRKIVMEAQRENESGRGRRRLDPIDVAMPAGMRLVAMTAEPLAVRIPR